MAHFPTPRTVTRPPSTRWAQNAWAPMLAKWVWVNTYRYQLFSGMNIHKSQLWLGVNYRGTIGFDTSPNDIMGEWLVYDLISVCICCEFDLEGLLVLTNRWNSWLDDDPQRGICFEMAGSTMIYPNLKSCNNMSHIPVVPHKAVAEVSKIGNL